MIRRVRRLTAPDCGAGGGGGAAGAGAGAGGAGAGAGRHDRLRRRRAQGRDDLRLLSTRRDVDAARGRHRLERLDGLARQIVVVIIYIDDVVPSFRLLARRPSARLRSASP